MAELSHIQDLMLILQICSNLQNGFLRTCWKFICMFQKCKSCVYSTPCLEIPQTEGIFCVYCNFNTHPILNKNFHRVMKSHNVSQVVIHTSQNRSNLDLLRNATFVTCIQSYILTLERLVVKIFEYFHSLPCNGIFCTF